MAKMDDDQFQLPRFELYLIWICLFGLGYLAGTAILSILELPW
jgi:hypothetical protein